MTWVRPILTAKLQVSSEVPSFKGHLHTTSVLNDSGLMCRPDVPPKSDLHLKNSRNMDTSILITLYTSGVFTFPTFLS